MGCGLGYLQSGAKLRTQRWAQPEKDGKLLPVVARSTAVPGVEVPPRESEGGQSLSLSGRNSGEVHHTFPPTDERSKNQRLDRLELRLAGKSVRHVGVGRDRCPMSAAAVTRLLNL